MLVQVSVCQSQSGNETSIGILFLCTVKRTYNLMKYEQLKIQTVYIDFPFYFLFSLKNFLLLSPSLCTFIFSFLFNFLFYFSLDSRPNAKSPLANSHCVLLALSSFLYSIYSNLRVYTSRNVGGLFIQKYARCFYNTNSWNLKFYYTFFLFKKLLFIFKYKFIIFSAGKF